MLRTQRNAMATILAALAVAIAPALTPAVLAYNADASGPDATTRLILPNLDRLDRVIDPFGDDLLPRRAMESPREWDDVWVAIGLAVCGAFGGWFAGACGVAGVSYALSQAEYESKPDVCSMANNDPMVTESQID